jgi:UDP-N-acetylglucosamine:LPS N-acetylglucosamine transferase
MGAKMRLLLFILKYLKPQNKFLCLWVKWYIKISCIVLKNLKRKDLDLIILDGEQCENEAQLNSKHYDDYFLSPLYALSDSVNLIRSCYTDSNLLYNGIRLEGLLGPKSVMVITLEGIYPLLTTKNIWEQERFEEAVILNGIFEEERAFEIFCKSKGIPVKKIYPFSSLSRKIYDCVLRKSVSVAGIKFSKQDIRKDLDYTQVDILLFAFYINHISPVLIIANELIERGYSVIIITSRKFLNNEKLKKVRNRIKVEFLESYVTEEILRNIKMKEKEYNSYYENTQDIISKNFLYQGINIWPLIKDSFNYLFSNLFPLSVGYIDIINRLFNIKKPNFVLGIHAYRSVERAFFEVAKKKSIPTMLIYHAIIPETLYTDFSVANRVAVHGEGMKRILMRQGLSEDKMIVTGNPVWDKLVRESKSLTKNGCKEYLSDLACVNPNKKLIVFTTGGGIDMDKRILKNLIEIIQKNSDIQLLVKLHPAERLDYYDEVLERAKERVGNIPVIRDVDLHKTLCASDLVITIYSTTALESMILDKPVLIVNFEKGPDRVPYVRSGAALGVYDEKDLEEGIKKALYDREIREKLEKARKDFVYDYSYIQDGKATERVVNLITRMIEEKRKRNEN